MQLPCSANYLLQWSFCPNPLDSMQMQMQRPLLQGVLGRIRREEDHYWSFLRSSHSPPQHRPYGSQGPGRLKGAPLSTTTVRM